MAELPSHGGDLAIDDLQIQAHPDPPAGWADLADTAAEDYFGTLPFVLALLAHHPDARPLWLTARAAGRLVGGLVAIGRMRRGLRRWHSLPDGTSGGPLVDPAIAATPRGEIVAGLAATLRSRLGGRDVVATLSLPAGAESRDGDRLRAAGWEHLPIPASVVPVSGGIDHVEYEILPKNRRNERNRGLRRGAVIGTSRDPDDIAEFYPIYRAAAAGWGVEAAPLGLLQQLVVEGEGRAFLCTVHYEGRLVGAHLNLHHGRRVTAWVGATLPEHNRMIFPATLLIWQGLVECDARGAEFFDLGGSAGRTKLAEFKRLLGAEIEERGLYRSEVAWFRTLRRLRARVAGTGGPDDGEEA